MTDWIEQSKNRYVFRGTVGGTLATLVASEPSFNGHPVLRNTSTEVELLRLWIATAPRSVIIVERTTSSGAYGGIWGNTYLGIRREALSPNWRKGNGDDWAVNGKLYVNGVATFTQPRGAPGILEAYNANPLEPVFYRTSLFGYSRFGEFDHPLRWWQGDIAEVAAFDRVLTEAERASIVGYLGKKYRIATSFAALSTNEPASSANKEGGSVTKTPGAPSEASRKESK